MQNIYSISISDVDLSGISAIMPNTQSNINFKQILESYTKYGLINGSNLAVDLFQIKPADIFISYSHLNKEKAYKIANYLMSLGLSVFLDYIVWSESDGLLRELDNQFCKNADNMYDYDKRNRSTAHSHAILSLALFKQIKSSTLLFVINDGSNIVSNVKNSIDSTLSPWIYEEVVFADELIKIKRNLNEDRSFFHSEPIPINYELPLGNYKKINSQKLLNFKNHCILSHKEINVSNLEEYLNGNN